LLLLSCFILFPLLSDYHPAFNRNDVTGCHEITRRREQQQGLLVGVNPRSGKKLQGSDETFLSDDAAAALEDDGRKPTAGTAEMTFGIENDDNVVVVAAVDAVAATAGSLIHQRLLPQMNRSLWQQQQEQQQVMETTTSPLTQMYYRRLKSHHHGHHHRHQSERMHSQYQEHLGLGDTALYPTEHKLPPPSTTSTSLSPPSPYPHPLESCLEPRTIEEMMQDPDSTTSVGTNKHTNSAKKLKQYASMMEKKPFG
jgi:hypothetical protein